MASLNSGGASMRKEKDYSSYDPSKDRGSKKFRGGKGQGGYKQGGGFGQGSGGYNQSHSGKKSDIILNAEYVHAPYNFVPQWEIVQRIDAKDFQPHDEMDDTLYSGKIAYTIRAMTPIYIGNGKKKEEADFVKNARGEYAIPGSSVRGLIRTNAQILGFADFSEDVDDYSLMFRKVGGTANDEINAQYKALLGDRPVQLPGGGSISVLTKVKAGYICKIGNRYRIYGSAVDTISTAFEDMNYYIVGEKKILEQYRDYVNGGKKGAFAYDALILGKKNKLAHKPRWDNTHTYQIDPFTEERIQTRKSEMIQYKGDKNRFYLSDFFPVSYELSGGRYVTAVRAPGICSRQGYALLSGPMNQKKAVYIIPEIDREKEVYLLDPEKGPYAGDLQSFRIDYKKRENTLVLRDYPKPDRDDPDYRTKKANYDAVVQRYKAFFDLPSEEGMIKPVFYFENGGHVYFGFTPHLRLYYHHTIHAGLIHKDADGYDIVKSVFGYARKKDSRKGKVYFSDAVVKDSPEGGTLEEVVLAEPKPTNYYHYLSHKNGYVSTYNDETYTLSGVKQYWLHEKIMQAEAVTNDKIKTSLRPLPEKTVFKGKVRFENLTEKELGLLLWSMKLESNSCMNIGMGKPYGYGVIKLELIEEETVQVMQEEAYDLKQGLVISPFRKLDIDHFIKAYKEKAAGLYGKAEAEEVMDIDSIRAFFRMKDSEQILPDSKLKYMTMDEFRKQRKNNAVLPTVDGLDEQLKKKKE